MRSSRATVRRGTRFPNRSGPRGDPAAAPLYTVADAQRSLSLLVPVAYDRLFEPKASIRFRFRDAGHILGSSIVELWADIEGGARKLVFSGDLGQPGGR